ncbi:MAG: DUF6089 family protein [Ginsengibacter sp.]
MRLAIISFTFCLVSFCADAQNFHINLFAGASNYQGDLQDKRFTFSQSHFAGGAGLSYDITDKFSVRGGFLLSKLSGDDKLGRNKLRNLNFTTNLAEVNIGLEYYITRLQDHALTPYVFGGIAVYHFSPYTYDTSGNKFYLRPLSTEGEGFIQGVDKYKLTQFAIPFGGGVKLSLSENVNVGIELGLRKLFTDRLDDVSTTYVDQILLQNNRGSKAVELAYRANELKNGTPYPPANTIRGGSKNKDWYYFTGLTASFRLGNGGFGGGGGRRSKYGCPANVN